MRSCRHEAPSRRTNEARIFFPGSNTLEAAHTIADEPGAKVTLSYREKAFTRAKEKNRKKVDQAATEGRLQMLFESKVKAVHDATVEIEQGGKVLNIPNQAIIVCAGGILPTPFLKEIGIEIETKFGTA